MAKTIELSSPIPPLYTYETSADERKLLLESEQITDWSVVADVDFKPGSSFQHFKQEPRRYVKHCVELIQDRVHLEDD